LREAAFGPPPSRDVRRAAPDRWRIRREARFHIDSVSVDLLGVALATVGGVRGVVAAVAVVVLGLSGLASRGHRGVTSLRETLTPQAQATDRRTVDHYACLERRLHAVVPRHARVIVVAGPKDYEAQQRLTEMATPWARPVARRADAQLGISLAPDTSPTACDGLTVTAAAP
jgi:hypothetical protein